MDMNNKLCVITGANSGIGFETAKELARQGAFIVMVCRNEDKALAAKKEIMAENTAGVDIVLCDFSSQDDIRKAASEIKTNYQKIDILINNHGFVSAKYNETIEGLEETFGVNHIGYFLFTNLLLDNILASEKARIINVASDAHRSASKFDPENLQLKNNFSSWKAYSNSKLYNILFTIELADRLKDTNVTVNCLHPGVIKSNFGKSGSSLFKIFWKIGGVFMKNNEQGAQTTIYLATSDEVEEVNGAYFKDSKVKAPSNQAFDKVAAQQLWEKSEELCSQG